MNNKTQSRPVVFKMYTNSRIQRERKRSRQGEFESDLAVYLLAVTVNPPAEIRLGLLSKNLKLHFYTLVSALCIADCKDFKEILF